MEEKFRAANGYEQRVALKCMTIFRDERIGHFSINAFFWGFIVLVAVIALSAVGCKGSIDSIKRFDGDRPKFEDYEDKILSEVYEYVQIHTNDTYPTTDINIMSPVTGSKKGYYKLVKEPSEIDYEKYDFRKNKYGHTYTNTLTASTIVSRKYKDAPEYSRVVKEAKQYFDENIDSRISRAGKVKAGATATCIGIIVVYILLVGVLGTKSYANSMNARVKLIEAGDFSVIKATMIGREEHHYSKSSPSYKLEVQTEDGEKLTQEVKEKQYEAYEAGLKCYVVKLKGEYGFYDEYDIVWEELCGADTIF